MATTNVRLAREQCEKAFAAYIIAAQASPPAWAASPFALTTPTSVGIYIRKGQFNDQGQYTLDRPDEIPLPAICVACPKTKPHDVMEYPVCELHVLVLTGIDEANASTIAAARLGFLAELFDETNQTALFTALNKPVGTDNRKVKNFNMWGMYQTEDMGQEDKRHWIDHLVYEVHCVPSDDVDGDGQD